MDSKTYIGRDFHIPEQFIRVCSPSRSVCLVHESWVQQVKSRCSPRSDASVWGSLNATECGVFLAPSYPTIQKPWVRVSIKTIAKSDRIVSSFVEEPLSRNCGPGLSELLSHVSNTNFRGVWEQSQQKYCKAKNPNAVPRIPLKQREYNDIVRSVLIRLFRSSVLSLLEDDTDSKITETTHVTQHPNLLPAYAVYESAVAFYIVQPYMEYSLHDIVTFSPALLTGSYTKPLFILYQVLHAIKHSHQMGVSSGDIQLRDVLIDNKLWVSLTQPHMKCVCSDQVTAGLALKAKGEEIPKPISNNSNRLDIGQCGPYEDYSHTELSRIMQQWVHGEITNFDYLMILNHLAGRRMGDPNHHPFLPWVMDFTQPNGGYRDMSRSKFRLNKGDRQLDLTFDTSCPFPDDPSMEQHMQIPHHISDVLSDITYYVYTARVTPKSILCTHVRSKWVPNEYPSTMQRMQEWTPDECIPEFFIDPTIFTSIHEDLPDLELPQWANSAEDFIEKHLAVLEGDHVSQRLHQWIDLNFGHKLSGSAAVKSKNVCLQLVDQHTELVNHGVVQLFHHPHPPRLPRVQWPAICQPRMRHANLASPLHGEVPEKKEKEGPDKKQKDNATEPRPEEASILLPKGFDPLSALDQLESMYNFSMRTAHSAVPDRAETSVGPGYGLKDKLVARDLQALGCLIVELFHSSRLRVLSPVSPLVKRYDLVRTLCAKIKDDLPRPIRQAVSVLLRLKSEWTPDRVDPVTGALFSYDVISKEGLPPPSANLLLHPQASILPFPTYFPSLYSVLARLKSLEDSIQHIEFSGAQQSAGQHALSRNMSKEKVSVLLTYISKLGPTLGKEGLELLLPYIIELLRDPATCVHAAWSLFEPVAQILGPFETTRRLLPHLTALLDSEALTRKHMKLYHRSFVIQLLIRLGATSFLQHFTTLLIEASAGYKNFTSDDSDRQISNDTDGFPTNGLGDDDYPSVFVEESVLGSTTIPSAPISGEKTPEEPDLKNVPLATEALPDDEWLPGALEETHSDSGSLDQVSSDRTDSNSIGSGTDQAETFAETTSQGSEVGASEELLGRSVGRLSVHSVSRLLQEEMERNASTGGDTTSLDEADMLQRRNSYSDMEDDTGTDSKGDDVVPTTLVRSETEEFASSMWEGGSVDYNISHVAGETIKWLSHRLGPVLTAKWLSRNLLRMLALCYYGDEQLEPLTKDIGYTLSTTNKPVAGDYNASQVLDCLSCIAVLYGEHVILLQYFPHCREMITQAQKKLTGRSEAGLISTIALLNHILPYLSDATLMDILQETIFKDIVLPLLKLVASVHVSFPSGARARTVICHKLIDGLYIISLRIGFEMTRQNMTFVLQKFFAAFSRVHDEKLNEASRSDVKSPSPDKTNDGSSTNNVYMEIKHDAETGGYKIGAQMKPSSWQPSHQRQGSGGFRYSLSPATQEDETDTKGVDSQDHIMTELRQTFTPHLAHLAYIPFCKLAGGIHMEQNLINDDLIRQLCTMYDEALSQQNAVAACKEALEEAEEEQINCGADDASGSARSTAGSDDALRAQSPASDDDNVSGSFGRNVSVAGNKIVIAEDEIASLDVQPATGNRGRRKSGESAIDDNKLRSPEMDFNKQRHLKGNWLAYWEHELGLSEREMNFNFKQIKLQTFSGHTNSIRSLYILDNENSFISASKDKTVKLWSLRSFGDGTGRVGCQWTYGNHKKSVFAVTFLETVRLAASCDSVVHIWDPFMGMGVRQFDSQRNPPITVVTPMPAPHCTLIAATTEATLRFLDVRAASYMHEFKCSTGPAGTMPAYRIGFIENSLIRCTAVSPDGHWVAAGYSSGIISIIDIRTGLLLATWKGHEGEILQVKAYNNKSILTTSLDQTMTLWNVEDAMAACHFKGTTEPVHCAVFYRNEVLSATTGNRVGVHTSVDRKACFSSTKLRSDVFRGVLTTMAVLPQNRLLLLGADNGTIRLLA